MDEAKKEEEKAEKFYTLLNDFAFKWVFGQASNSRILIRLLNTLLDLNGKEKIIEITFLNPFNYSSFINEKYSVVDTRVKDGNGNLYNIELQNLFQYGFDQRSLYYLAKLYSSQLIKGDDYSMLKPAIGISIMNFELFKDSDRIQEIFTFKNEFDYRNLNNSMTLHFIDLTKYDGKKPVEKRTGLEKWLHVLRFSEEYDRIKNQDDANACERLEVEIVEKNQIRENNNAGDANMLNIREITDEDAIQMAVNELHKINANPETRAYLEACDRYVTDMALNRGYAYHEGRKSRQAEIDALTNEKDAANKRADEAKQIADAANKRADDAIAGQTQMVRNMLANGKTKEEIIGMTGMTEAKYNSLIEGN